MCVCVRSCVRACACACVCVCARARVCVNKATNWEVGVGWGGKAKPFLLLKCKVSIHLH